MIRRRSQGLSAHALRAAWLAQRRRRLSPEMIARLAAALRRTARPVALALLCLLATTCAAQRPCTIVQGKVLTTTNCSMREVKCSEMAFPMEWPAKDTTEWRYVVLQTYALHMRPRGKRCRSRNPLGVGVRCFDCVPGNINDLRSPLQMPGR